MSSGGLRLGICLGLLGACACAPAFHTGPMPGEPQATYAKVAGARVRFVDRGSGPVVVLLHGFASSLETWEPVRPALERDHRVISLDLKGFGWTDRPNGDYSPRAQALLVFALLDARGVKSASVVAHSWGASVALQMALLHPERVERIALYDAWVYEEQLPSTFHFARSDGVGEALFGAFYAERSEDKIAQAFYDERNVSQRLIEDVERALDRPGTVAAALAATRGQRFAEVEGRYREIKQPVLLLWGREDRVTPIEIGERLVRDLPQAKLSVYPRTGHFPMLEAGPESTRDLAEFLKNPAAMARKTPSPPPAQPVAAPPPVAPPSAPGDTQPEGE
ncbi:MAG: alpha/beta fold hydrolase [Myxococcales bacterium]|nr:alpha/beta fold hydrolase [Myxococcales bacterium]